MRVGSPFVAMIVALMAAGGAFADDAPFDHFGRLPGETMRIMPGELFDASHAEHALPPLGYANDEEWQALTCAAECALVPVTLLTRDATVHSHGDDVAMQGQTLALARNPEGQLIAILRGLPGTVKPRPETRLHAGLASYPRPRTAGTLEIDIPDARGGARIVPRMRRDAHSDTPLGIYLEAGGRRQLLRTLEIDGMAGFSGLATGPRLLRWAGDLDGDGRVDLIMSFNSRTGERQTATLYLSSAATGEELIGAVANFDYFPVEDSGC